MSPRLRPPAPLLLVAIAAVSPGAAAFDAATTHAALTERAVFASSLKTRIADLFAWGKDLPLGLYQTLKLPGGDARRGALLERLGRLDPADGGAPGDGALTAAGWLVAGAILEETPPARAANHRFDPTAPAGRPPSLSSVAWMSAAANDLSLARFIDARDRSLRSPAAADRAGAAAEALLVAGALLHLVEDAGEPAYVHGDASIDLFQARAPFSRYVAERYGRFAVPGPAGPPTPLSHLGDAIHKGDGSGLADRTAGRFYSLGLIAAANHRAALGATRPRGLPPLAAGADSEGYVEDAAHRKLAAFHRAPGGDVRFSLDERCYQDAAAVLLPEAAQAALSALEHLFRGGVSLDAGRVKSDVALGAGRVSVLVEDEGGLRREIAGRDVPSAEPGAELAEVPAGNEDRMVIAVFRGVDKEGEPLLAVSIAGGR